MKAIACSGHHARQISPASALGPLCGMVFAVVALSLATPASAAAPSITSLDPSSGAIGSIVAINGAGFGATQGSSTVTVGGVTAAVKTWSDTRVVTVIPSGVTTGQVTVTVSALASNGQTFTVVPAPSISGVSPAAGAAGTVITISGSGFGAVQGSLGEVMFGGVPCHCSPVWSGTSIRATVPPEARTGNLVVAAPGGVTSNAVTFSVAPLITLLSPGAGTVGSSVTISGLAFGSTQGTSTVTFNGTAAAPTSWSDTSVAVPVPAGASVGNVVVTAGGLASGGALFAVIPTVTSVSPASGPAGTLVTIAGNGFGASQANSTVAFNGIVSAPTSWSDTSISVPTPNGATNGNVVVTVGGNASNGASFTPTLGIGGVSPGSGPVGSAITISGTGFGSSQGNSTITFNGTPATPTSWSAAGILAPVPNGAATGNIVVTVSGTASNGVGFTVTPAISGISPSSGTVGTMVTLTGTNFGATQGSSTVTFNGTPASPSNWSNTAISVPAPSGTTSGVVVVTVGGNASNGVGFTTTLGINGESPTSGPVGALITIRGTGFGAAQGTSTVTFNGTAAAPASWSADSIVVPVPSAATTGNLVVTVGGTASNGVNFVVTPGISGLSPAAGAAGTAVTIAGTNFGAAQGNGTVTFNGATAATTIWSNSQIVAQVPGGVTAGNVVVTVNGVASNGVAFSPTLGIGGESPSSGPVGTAVTISGTGFGNAQGTSTVTFNGTAATPTSWSNGVIVVPVPGAAATGSLVVTVGGTASNGVNFVVTPGISGLSPSSGAVGTPVTIAGTNFGSSQGNGTVTFNGVAATATSWSNTQIMALVPSGAATGNVVVAAGGSASNGIAFTPTLGVGGESPSSGPVGTVVTITGTAFGSAQGSSTVTFNGVLAPVASWSNGSIVAQVPGGAATGSLVVTVGGAASNATSFTVTTAPLAQINSGFGAGVVSTSVPFLSSNTAGNLLWVAVGAGGQIMPPTDSLGNTYTLAGTVSAPGGSGSAAVYYAVSSRTGVNTVTCSQTAADDIHCHIAEVSGLVAVSPLDQSGSTASSSSCSVATGGATAFANEWVAAFFYDSSADPALTAGAGYGAMQLSNNNAGDAAFSESETASAAGVQTATCGGNATGTVLQLITTFQSLANAPAPAISSLTPSSGPVGSAVVIAGSNFGAAQGGSTVAFNGVPASVIAWGPSSITAAAPSGATTGNVVVTVGGVSSGGAAFTVAQPPSISTLNPGSGPVGSAVVIAGSNFGTAQGGSTVAFNGAPASVISWNTNSITAMVPGAAASGNVVVTVAGGVSSAGVSYTVVPGPGITSLTPTSGAAGSSVTIAGSNFGPTQGDGTVTFNGTPVTLLTWSNSSITAVVPAAATSGNVVVTAAGGVSSAGVSFTVLPAPVLTSLTPTSGAVGTSVTIVGNNFGMSQGNSTVTFNGAIAAARGRVAPTWTNTKIVVNVPSGATSGPVVVTVGGKPGNPLAFGVSTYITSLSPAFGPVGTLISVNGGGFGQSQGQSTVTFNGMAATPTNWSDSSIIAPVPSGVTTGNVVVTVGSAVSNGVLFTAAPVINTLSANTLAVGASLTINGLNFGASQGAGAVTFNGTAGQPTSWSSTQIVVPVPIGATPGNVVVTANGMASNGVNFTPGPFVSALSLAAAAVGTPITITGGNFGISQGGSTVTFNGTAGQPTSWSGTQIVVPVPIGATPGNVVVTVNGLASNGASFGPGPSLTGLNVASGLTGATVTLTGVNFGSAQGASAVTFNGAPATSFPQWTNTQVQAVVPVTASTGEVVLTVGGLASNGALFTVLPNIASLSPGTGIVGASVAVNGSGFGASQGTSVLTFNGAPATPVSWNTTQIVAQVPAAATTGSVVVTVAGNASNGVNFTVAPAISGLSPASGPVGTEVTINGTTFGATQGSSTVTLNGASVTPSSWSSAQIVFAVPGGAATGNVVVTVGGTSSAPVVFTVTQGQAGARSELTSFVASDGSAHTFYVGPDQHVYHLFWNSTNSWQFQDLTGITGSNVAVPGSPVTSFLKSDGSYNVAYLDGNSHVNELVWSGGVWSDQDLTAAAASAPAASNSQLASLTDAASDRIYYLGANQHEYQLYWDGFNWNSQDLTALSGTNAQAASGSALAGFALNDGSEHSFYIGNNQHVHQMLNIPGAGYFDQDLTYTAALNLAGGACAQQNGTCPVSGTTTVGFGANGSWNFLTVTSNVACNVATFGDPAPGVSKACYYVNASFPVAAAGSSLAGFNDGNGDHVDYLDGNGHNHELSLKGDPGAVSGPWIDQDQTKNSGTNVTAAGGSALTGFPTSDGNRHSIYLDASHHVDQVLYEPGNNAWVNQDLTSASGTTATAAPGSGLTAFVQSAGNVENVQYLDGNGHINQLGLTSANVWQNQDLTAVAVNAGASVPGIGSLSPTSGPAGAAVTINGANFGASQGSSTVTFNGIPATPTSWSNTQIAVPVPSGATTGNVVVTVGAVASNGVLFGVTPTIGNLFPTSGPVGSFVTISGSNFGNTQGNSTVSFNGTLATPTGWGTTQIVVPVPGGATTGNVVVTVSGVATNVGSFGVNPAIAGLSPASGLIGSQVTIAGTTFGGSQGSSTVTFNGVAGTPTSWNSSQIVVPVPAGATTGSVVVTVGGLSSNGATFTVANPSITSLSPPAGLVGSSLTINGANFGSTQGTSTVTFGGQRITPTSWSAGAIGVTVPGGASLGNNSVVVTVNNLASNPATFVVSATTPPAVASLSPSSGSAGDSVVIMGSNFGGSQGSSTVTFNGVAASVTAWTANSITAVVPAGATSGLVMVTVGGVPSVPQQAMFIFLAPTILGIQPGAEAVNAMVTITGIGFGQQQGQSTVMFGNVAAPPATSWSPNKIVVAVPAALPAGAVNVMVTVPGQPASNQQPFTVLPGVTGLSLHAGPPQVGFVINGTNFGNQQPPMTSVSVGGVQLAVTNWAANGITVQVPANSPTLTGQVVITVGNQAAQGSNNTFSIAPAFGCGLPAQ